MTKCIVWCYLQDVQSIGKDATLLHEANAGTEPTQPVISSEQVRIDDMFPDAEDAVVEHVETIAEMKQQAGQPAVEDTSYL